ncbi:MAG: hypothetical protein ACE5GX_18805 [Thermoanaerobaculia bacterium]
MSFLERQLEDPVRFAWIRRAFYVGLALVALAEIVLPLVFQDGHPHFPFESWPAWGSLYGLISCVAIILVSKLLGKVWLMRREDYYDS